MVLNRRTLFRDYMTRLDPTEDPGRAIESGFHVSPPGSAGERIARRLEIEPKSSHLLVGGIGTGKTTELLAIQRNLESTDDIRAVIVNIPSRHTLAELKPGVLMAIAAKEASKLAEDELEPMPGEGEFSDVLLERGVSPTPVSPATLFGAHKGSIEVLGDLIEPLDVEWEASR